MLAVFFLKNRDHSFTKDSFSLRAANPLAIKAQTQNLKEMVGDGFGANQMVIIGCMLNRYPKTGTGTRCISNLAYLNDRN